MKVTSIFIRKTAGLHEVFLTGIPLKELGSVVNQQEFIQQMVKKKKMALYKNIKQWPSKVYTTLLFDLDGTLMNSRLSVMHAAYEVACSYIPGKFTFAELNKRFGEPFSSFVEFTGLSHLHDEIRRSYVKQVKKNHDLLVKPYPFVKEGLTQLKKLGYKLGIVTNKERELVELGLSRVGIDGLFHGVVCIEDVHAGKPAAEPILKALSLMQSQPEETLMIGDTLFDIQAAVRAGTASAHLQNEDYAHPNPFQATYCFKDFSGLFAFLKELHQRNGGIGPWQQQG
ncbi:HAD family hydrolase [Aneurinibacillus sp. Ricciae_BoGa-3]|uniref:HAD family hydrolase n=1 Tax=Aneurinibacillus sp. Ricciae_BoGa-3 TaxID=3022697 RepID=UPI0023403A6B|nr:HAD family hydrolase [Aneurinibacillus sp. Ricciae_BoGa-3]WCK52385.1 HAD family hydrolase [Aneurinibacillus sp. Ricciae_BoGa-3]